MCVNLILDRPWPSGYQPHLKTHSIHFLILDFFPDLSLHTCTNRGGGAGITKLWAESGHAKSNKWFGVVQVILSWYQLEMMFQNMLLCGSQSRVYLSVAPKTGVCPKVF